MTYKSYNDLHVSIVHGLLPQIPMDVTRVVGVPRSGLLVASMVAFDRHIHLGAHGVGGIDGGDRTKHCMVPDTGRVLVIDDSVTRGIKIAVAKAEIEAAGRSVLTAAVYVSREKANLVDLHGEILEHPRIFAWNLFNHGLGPRMMFDMDGVLCKDPDVYDDDGEGYRSCIAGIRPLRLPRWPIGYICTNRIGRWRDVTEAWLSRHGVRYGKLLMHPAGSAAERRRNMMGHKIECYGNSDAVLFVESSRAQAVAIADATGRPVLSLEDNVLFGSGSA
jgi:hypothetical protein